MDGAIINLDRERGVHLAQQYAAEQDAQRLAAADGGGRRVASGDVSAPPRPGRRGAPREPAEPVLMPLERAPRDADGHVAPGVYGQPGARPPAPIPETRPAPGPPTARPPRETPPPREVALRPETPGGRWRVQLGAFRNEGNAREQWSRVAGALGGARPSYVHAGAVTRLQAGPFASRAAAAAACRAAKVACDVVAP